jgi:excisionase family DNA binding protein
MSSSRDLTKAETAMLLKRDTRTIERLVAGGELKGVRRGRATLIPLAALANYLAQREAAAAARPPTDLHAARLAKEKALARIREVEARTAEGAVLQRAAVTYGLEDLVARIRAAVIGARRHGQQLACTCRPRGQLAQRLEGVLRQVLMDVDDALRDSEYDRLGLLGAPERPTAPRRRSRRKGETHVTAR